MPNLQTLRQLGYEEGDVVRCTWSHSYMADTYRVGETYTISSARCLPCGANGLDGDWELVSRATPPVPTQEQTSLEQQGWIPTNQRRPDYNGNVDVLLRGEQAIDRPVDHWHYPDTNLTHWRPTVWTTIATVDEDVGCVSSEKYVPEEPSVPLFEDYPTTVVSGTGTTFKLHESIKDNGEAFFSGETMGYISTHRNRTTTYGRVSGRSLFLFLESTSGILWHEEMNTNLASYPIYVHGPDFDPEGGDSRFHFADAYDLAQEGVESVLKPVSNYGTVVEYFSSNNTGWNPTVLSSKFINVLAKHVKSPHPSRLTKDRYIRFVLSTYRAKPSEKFFGKVSLYRTAEDAARDRRTAMKAGKAFKYMFPHLQDKEVLELVNDFRTEMAPKEYKLHVSSEAGDFKHAYSHRRADYEDPRCSTTRKSLANSCMQADFGHLSCHPCEVYASGDFEIAWLTDKGGYIAGRVVIYRPEEGRPQAAPVYGVCEVSLNKLEEYLVSIDANFTDPSWDGAKLNKVMSGTSIIGPYSDLDQIVDEHVDDHLVFSNYGDYELCRTDGFLDGASGSCCVHCEDHFDPESEGYDSIEAADGAVCEYCYENHYVWDEINQEHIRREDSVEYKYRSYNGVYTYEGFTRCDEDDIVYCHVVEEYWLHDYTTYSEAMSEYVPTHLVGDYPDHFPPEDEDEEEEASDSEAA